MSTYYEIVHRHGYGREDHLADEIIARAARRLGVAGAEQRVRECVGFASHACGSAALVVRAKERTTLERALREARAEMPRRVSCCLDVVTRRVREEPTWARGVDPMAARPIYITRVVEERRGAQWVELSREVA